MVLPKKGAWIPLDGCFPFINSQYELSPGPMSNHKIEGKKCPGTVAFCKIDCLRCYWQLPLAEEAGGYFMVGTRDDLCTP